MFSEPQIKNIPSGMIYQWCSKTLFGKPHPDYEKMKKEWLPVPVERHPELVGFKNSEGEIEWSGNVLMFRDREKSREQIELDEDKALMNAGDLGRVVKVEIPIYQEFAAVLGHPERSASARYLAELNIRSLLECGVNQLVPDSEGGGFFLIERDPVRVPKHRWLRWIFEFVSTPKRSSW